ncbi:uroporphyrinogen decarboxylase [Arthrobacter sp. Soil782]|uniref:mandelate racemase/muconate lactonizing enzyme family protein n=1 Tax=Arthrobacter sp. Soil782 TaxID=1736410 RepID=UPI0006FB3F7E|nr:mandelate racemase/muconate lactonizing enzyme family protein [Arthrobacter sp. Soil782]KRF06347.1 uroporphyrinogen decarboxylase [Arthrobacter sp. Soil782]
MSTIQSVTADLYRVPLPVKLTDSMHGDMDDFELITVRIRDEDGVEGLGYTYTVNAGGAAVAVMINRYMADTLVGQDSTQIERLWEKLWWQLHYAGRGGHQTSAISAIDIALWDLQGRRLQTPLWQLFGGYDPKVPVYAGGIDLQFTLDQLLKQTDGFQEAGFRAIKMKVGRLNTREDIERVAKMRAHLGDDFPLMVDANMRWTADRAITAARALQEFNLIWLEEPIIPDDLPGMRRVLRDGGIPIAGGENLHTLHEFRAAIDAGALSYPEPDVTNCGGYTVFRKIASLAEAHNLPVTSHGVHDLTVHALAAAPNRTYMEAHGFSLERYMTNPMPIVDGFVTAPDTPGHGIDLDFAALEEHRA